LLKRVIVQLKHWWRVDDRPVGNPKRKVWWAH
jgi:hypothetical protein